MTLAAMQALIDLIEYKDWEIRVLEREGTPYLQVTFQGEDLVTGEVAEQRGRKWMLSPWMTKSEVVQTAFKAVLAAEEHEAREAFRYKGRTVFGPHFDVEALADLATYKENLDMRTGAWVA